MFPHLGDVEGVLMVVACLLLGHNLDLQCPLGILPALDSIEQVVLAALPVLSDELLCLLIGEVLDPLLADPVVFDPYTFASLVDHAVCVASESVHVPVGIRDSAVGHDDCDLVQGFGYHGPEIPVVLCGTHVGLRVPLDRMVEVGESECIPDEEHGRVVTDQVPVTLLGVELDSESPDVTFCVRSSPFSGNGRESDENGGLLPNL